MLITEDIFQAFLKCETKSYLKLSGAVGDHCEFSDWEGKLIEEFKHQFYAELRSNYQENEILLDATLAQVFGNSECRLVFDCTVETSELISRIPMLERTTHSDKARQSPYIPVRLIPREKLASQDRLLLAFDAHVLLHASGKTTLFGKIIHGREHSIAKVKFDELLKTVEMVVGKIEAQQTSQTAPQLVLNKHCHECEFQARCRRVALEKDNLSLLAGMTEKEIKKQHSKGIFSVTQLSYTFRPRRRPKRCSAMPEKYSHALKALAIRERKIHIAGNPELKIQGTPVYLDVEGIPDRNFYYLIGLRFWHGSGPVQYSFWANVASEEEKIWAACLQTLKEIENPQLVHYGSYERAFLKRMMERYGKTRENSTFLDQLIAGSLNMLLTTHGQIYFPTYSNGLKEIAQFLGFRWTDVGASGLTTLIWRSEWERSKENHMKQKLITYNSEDCEALEIVTGAVAKLCQRQPVDSMGASSSDIVHTEKLKRPHAYGWESNQYSIPELECINKAAYWNYQREKIYIRSNRRLKSISQKKAVGQVEALPINKVIEYPPPSNCPVCQSTNIVKRNERRKIVHDIKFGHTSIKRWIMKHSFHRYSCSQCGATFDSLPPDLQKNKYGLGFVAYVIFQVIELAIPQESVMHSLNCLFKFQLSSGQINPVKSKAAQFYKPTHEHLLKRLTSGRLIHADETKANIQGTSAYVWVFTSMEEVVYYYTETREGNFLQELLRGFSGVLVSDFYAAYDSIDCPQQKCLIHLMRDLNNDLLKHPYDDELKALVQAFGGLLKPIIETVDKFGLKAHFLRKHKNFVERFYKMLSRRDHQSEITLHYKKRFEKNRDKLFTFLDYDNVPWNNNNAEHAIKAFARIRNVLRGSSTVRGTRDYLILLSVCETCKYKGASFLDFVRSGKEDIDEFISRGNRASQGQRSNARR
jgi:predicted RecB family nuclease